MRLDWPTDVTGEKDGSASDAFRRRWGAKVFNEKFPVYRPSGFKKANWNFFPHIFVEKKNSPKKSVHSSKVLNEKYAYRSVKIALLLSNVSDHLMRTTKTAVCLQTKAFFSLPLWVLIGVLAKFHE